MSGNDLHRTCGSYSRLAGCRPAYHHWLCAGSWPAQGPQQVGQGVMDPVVQGLKLFRAAGGKGSVEQEKESL